MDKKPPQLNQEKNIVFDRSNMVKEHNDLETQWDKLDSFDRDLARQGKGDPKNIDIYRRKDKLYETVTDIDRYRELAKSKENMNVIKTGDISDIEKIKQEKERVDSAIEEVKEEIELVVSKLSELRAKLDMPPSDDIPSLIDKKEKLSSLLLIQKKLEGKLKFETKKQGAQKEENLEDTKREKGNLDANIQVVGSTIRSLSILLEKRQSHGYGKIFEDQESFRALAAQSPNISDFEETKKYFLNIQKITENLNDKRSVDDNTESLYNVLSLFKRLSMNIKEFTSKIQDEDKRKEMGKIISSIADSIDKASFSVSRKAQALEAYKSVRLP